MTNEQNPNDAYLPDRAYSEGERNASREVDVLNTQISPQWRDSESALPDVFAEGLIGEVEGFLDSSQGELQSKEELKKLLQKLDAAIAINNEPYARELRARLIEQVGGNA
jgi:hypothetical protein